MNIAKRLLLPCFAVILSACGADDDASDVRQEKIYQFYEVRYDKASDETVYHAIFRKESPSGQTLQLDEGMSVTVNGITMRREHRDTDSAQDENNVYETIVKGPVGADTMFVWQDANGRKFTNTAKYTGFEEPSVPTNMSKSVEVHLDWLGASNPQAQEDTATATLKSMWSGQVVFATINVVKGEKLFTLPRSEMSRLRNGNTGLRIERKTHIPLAESTRAGGVMRVVTLGEEHDLEIVD